MRDEVIDFIRERSELTGLRPSLLVRWIGIHIGRYYEWGRRYGMRNSHNGHVPRDHWLAPWEREAIVSYYQEHPDEGYRRLAFMMLDEDVVAVSPSTVRRVLRQSGCMNPAPMTASKKGTGFVQPLQPHEHWHVDVSYLNLAGTFYYMCFVLDGRSRAIVHWDIREQMKAADIECIIQAGSEKYPGERPRIISDNGPQFISKEFKSFIRIKGMDHVRTSPFYPQSNGKIERYHQSLKSECIRPQCPSDLADAKRLVGNYVETYNDKRLHSAIGYITPNDMLLGRADAIHEARDRKLEAAREQRKLSSERRYVA